MSSKIIYHDIDPLLNYKGRYNRKSWEHLKKFGTLFILVDCHHPIFDINLRSVEQGDLIISTNDGIEYIVISVSKLEGTNLIKWIDIQPLFNENNWLSHGGLWYNMKLDGKSFIV